MTKRNKRSPPEREEFADLCKVAEQTSSKLLRKDRGWYTPKDLVGESLLRLSDGGYTEGEIRELLQSPGKRGRMFKNAMIDLWRKETAAKRGGQDPPTPLESVNPGEVSDTGRGPEDTIIQREEKDMQKKFLEKLFHRAGITKTEGKVLKLWSEGCKTEEIAQRLGIAKGTVYVQKCTGLKKLKEVSKSIMDKHET